MENIYQLYTIYDRVAQMFGPVYEALNDQVAGRSYAKVVSKVSPEFAGDYVLYCVGSYDMKKGVITPESMPRQIDVVIPERKNYMTEVAK